MSTINNSKILSFAVRCGIIPSASSDSDFVTQKGSAAANGDKYYNTIENAFRSYNGAWIADGSATASIWEKLYLYANFS